MLRTWMLTAATLAISPALHGQEIPIPAAPQLGVNSYILIDHATGEVIAESNPDEILDPASLTTRYVDRKRELPAEFPYARNPLNVVELDAQGYGIGTGTTKKVLGRLSFTKSKLRMV